MNLIALINAEKLYQQALEASIPYFKFSSWIESTVQKEVIAQLFRSKKDTKSQIPTDLITEEEKKTNDNRRRRSSVQKN